MTIYIPYKRIAEKRVRRRVLVFLAASFLFVVPAWAAAPGGKSEAALYDAFREYRLSLLQSGVDPVGYFSRSMLEGWLQMLLSDGAEKSSVTTIKSVRSRKRFGRYINVVHDCKIDRTGPYEAKLKLKISGRRSNQQREVTISYVLENEEWRIAFVAWNDTDAARMPTMNVVEEFPAVPLNESERDRQ